MPISSIRQDDIQSFDDDLLDQGIGSSVVDRLNRILSRTMSYAVRKGLRSGNPVQGVIVDYVPKDVQALDEVQTENLLRFVRNSKTFCFWYDHIRTLLNTGMRIGEFAGFVWDLMPPINPHVLRHTFCSRLCEVETNVSRIKEIMGHSDISVTLNIYNTVTLKAKKETMSKMVI